MPARPQPRGGSWRVAAVAALMIGAALCTAPLAGHSDEVDPHFYTVLARHMAEGGSWLEPSYLPSIYQRFRDHLPFGLWPWALALGLVGERALAPLALVCSLGTVSLVLLAGARVFGRAAALVGALVLVSTESYFRYAAQPHLDRLLLLLVTAATLPLWRPVPVPRSCWAWSTGLTVLAVLVKGPFGLLPLVATTFARAAALRSAREFLSGCVAAAVATLPAAAFLAHDAWLGDGSWWRGYVLDQLYASFLGLRSDGEQGLVPLSSLVGRFWPGLPLSLWGMAIGLRDLLRRRLTPGSVVAVHALATVALLCLPSRRIWHHALIVYPALALLAGIAAAPAVERLVASARFARAALLALVASASAATVASATGAGAWLTPRICLVPTRLVASLPAGTDVLVVAPAADWRAMAVLAAEYRLIAWSTVSFSGDVPLETWPGVSGLVSHGRRALAALVRADVPPGPHAGWGARMQEGNWTLWTRDPAPPWGHDQQKSACSLPAHRCARQVTNEDRAPSSRRDRAPPGPASRARRNPASQWLCARRPERRRGWSLACCRPP